MRIAGKTASVFLQHVPSDRGEGDVEDEAGQEQSQQVRIRDFLLWMTFSGGEVALRELV